jgi:hypothetical protein
MKETGLKIKLKEKEYICTRMVQRILVNGLTINSMGMDSKSGLMVPSMREVSKMVSNKVMEHFYGQMVQSSMESFIKTT